MAHYLYNPCQPCCTQKCGWGPYNWTTSSQLSAFEQYTISGSPKWTLNQFSLLMSSGSGTLYQTTGYPGDTPGQTGWQAGSATVTTVNNAPKTGFTQSGVFIGGGKVFYADWGSDQYLQGQCDPNGNISGAASQIPGATPASGDTIALCIQALGDGTNFTVSYSVNNKVIGTEAKIPFPTLTTGTSFNSGFWANGAANYGYSSMVCGTSCPAPGGGCSQCGTTVLAQCWALTANGIILSGSTPTAGPPNGSFCLQAAGCKLIDLNNSNSWTVYIGPNQYDSQIGSTYNGSVLTYNGLVFYALPGSNPTFNCSGSNTFNLAKTVSGSGWPQSITVTPVPCTQSPCKPIQSCGDCSWPTKWTFTLSGLSTAQGCPPIPAYPAGGPPVTDPYNNNCNFGLHTCESYNGTKTLTGGTGASGWTGTLGSDCWSSNDALNYGCGVATDTGPCELYCMSAGAIATWGWPYTGTYGNYQPCQYSPPGPGLLLVIRAWGGPLCYWWYTNPCETPPGGIWWAGGPSYVVPYWCSFNEIQCLQPITLNQISYTPGQYTFEANCVPAGLNQSPMCNGFPGSITLTPS
jgi:hypothetical protein